MNEAFNHRFTKFIQESGDKKKKVKGKVKNVIIVHKTFNEEMKENSSIYQSIVKKSEKNNIDINILGEVYDRGIASWDENSDATPQQLAFNRVNSFISGGRALKEDMDLVESEDFKPGQKVWLKVKKTATSPHNGKVHKVTDTHVIIKASTGFRNQLYKAKRDNVSSTKTDHGEFLKSWYERNKLKEATEGNSQLDPKKREVGTKSLVDAFRRDTPGQEVVDETAYSSDKQPVVVPAHYDDHGNLIPAKTHMRRTNRSIVNTKDNAHDGK